MNRTFVASLILTALVSLPVRQAAEAAEPGRQGAPGAAAQSQPAKPAGEIFGMPVSLENYQFAKSVALMFPPPWGASGLPPEKQEEHIWENLILHYKAYQRLIQASEDELNTMINELLRNEQKSFTRTDSPQEYQKWVRESVGVSVELFENQVRYLIQIKKLKDQVLEMQKPAVTEAEMHHEFMNEKNHVGGEIVVFDTKEQAAEFYEKVKDPKRWKKAAAKLQVRPVAMMTIEAYVDLWQVPQKQMDALHAMEIGSVAPPVPFGSKQWAVYRILEKRTGDLKDFPKERESYQRQLEMKKKYQGLQDWIKDVKGQARLKVYLPAASS